MHYYLGIDLGGTNIKAGVLDSNYKIISIATKKTNCPRLAEEIMDDMELTAREAIEKAGITLDDIPYVGIGCPGTVNSDEGIIDYSNNLDFLDVHVGEYLGKKLCKKIFVDNDANAAAYGEFKAGAAKGAKNFIAITLGTGVGSGVIIDGKIYRGSNFGGAELGHMIIVKGGKRCTCGQDGCLESYASATGLINLTKDAMKTHPESLMWQESEGDISAVNGTVAFNAANRGDKAAKEVVDAYIDYLGVGLLNIVNIFQPDILSIAGGVSNQGEQLLTKLRSVIAEKNFARNSAKQTQLRIAELGNDAGIIGAALLGI